MDLETLKSLDKKYAQAIADELLKRIETDDCLKDKLLETTKTLKGCIDYIKSEAKKQAEDGCAILTDDEVFQMAQHYFLEDSINESKAEKETSKKPNKAPKEDDDIDDEDEELEGEKTEEVNNTPEVVEAPKEVEKPKAEEPKKPSKKELVKKKLEEQVTLFDFML